MKLQLNLLEYLKRFRQRHHEEKPIYEYFPADSKKTVCDVAPWGMTYVHKRRDYNQPFVFEANEKKTFALRYKSLEALALRLSQAGRLEITFSEGPYLMDSGYLNKPDNESMLATMPTHYWFGLRGLSVGEGEKRYAGSEFSSLSKRERRRFIKVLNESLAKRRVD